jgi:hypothetical protein
MTILCEAIHPEFRVYCGLSRGHLDDHVGMIGKVPIVWPNYNHDDERVARAAINLVVGLFIIGAVLAIACAAIAATV